METLIDDRTAVELGKHFNAVLKLVPLRPIRSEADYDHAVSALNALLDAGGADEDHPVAELAATLGELIADYDAAQYPAQPVAPAEMLHHLMEAHDIRQGDLPEVGSQGVVSEVLRGRRELNLRQVKALAKRFAVPASVFLESE
jgi:HTH-type transcriptional regulator/antitoxin HigA